MINPRSFNIRTSSQINWFYNFIFKFLLHIIVFFRNDVMILAMITKRII